MNSSKLQTVTKEVATIISNLQQDEYVLSSYDDDILLEAMDITSLVVPSNLLGAQLLFEELENLSFSMVELQVIPGGLNQYNIAA